jgi:hypothetical protein
MCTCAHGQIGLYTRLNIQALPPAVSQQARAGGAIQEPVPTLALEAGSDEQPPVESVRVLMHNIIETPSLVGTCVCAHTETLGCTLLNIQAPSAHIQKQTPTNWVRRTVRAIKMIPAIFRNRDSLMARVAADRPDLQQTAVHFEHDMSKVRVTAAMRRRRMHLYTAIIAIIYRTVCCGNWLPA